MGVNLGAPEELEVTRISCSTSDTHHVAIGRVTLIKSTMVNDERMGL